MPIGGLNTAKLIQYANRFGGKVYSIDPLPGFDSEEWERENPDTFTMCRDLSLNVIKTIKDAQCFLIDGDHNWYTVYNELCQIYEAYGEDNFPLVMFHDILWPYDRRDLYYSPETIPAIYRHDYEKKAMAPSSKNLVNEGINGYLFNAKEYGGEKNGVLTAIEDFVKEHPTPNLDIYTIDVLHGLGMIASKEKYPEAVEHFYSASALKGAMQICESERLDKSVKINALTKKYRSFWTPKKSLRQVLKWVRCIRISVRDTARKPHYLRENTILTATAIMPHSLLKKRPNLFVLILWTDIAAYWKILAYMTVMK
ncbi:MAG: class I SAM-dependent methyltransferase [Oscillospiraceae bacterium]|nr:class I SAM-dependent methyltransferase [Oscillospiraceae bacterium]